MNIWGLIKVGGITMVLLLASSVLSIAIILERFISYRAKSRIRRKAFMLKIRQEIKKGGINPAIKLCEQVNAPFAQVVYAGLSFFDCGEKEISNNMERQVIIETTILERFTSVIGTGIYLRASSGTTVSSRSSTTAGKVITDIKLEE